MSKRIELFDPALCCSSGVCGPSLDPELVRVQADVEWLKSKGLEVNRYNLAQQPLDFANNLVVKERLQQDPENSLPIVLVDDKLIAAGFYPTREQFAALSQVSLEEETAAEASSSCCGSEGCC